MQTALTSGATVALGNWISALTVNGGITFDAGATYAVEVDPEGVDSDLSALPPEPIIDSKTDRQSGIAPPPPVNEAAGLIPVCADGDSV